MKARYNSNKSWLDKERKEFHLDIHYCVSGQPEVHEASLFRMREKDFHRLHNYCVSNYTTIMEDNFKHLFCDYAFTTSS